MEHTGSIENIKNNHKYIKEYQELQHSIENVLKTSGFDTSKLTDNQKSYATINVLKLLLGDGEHLQKYLRNLRNPFIPLN